MSYALDFGTGVPGGDARLVHRYPDPIATDGQRYAASSFGSRRYEA